MRASFFGWACLGILSLALPANAQNGDEALGKALKLLSQRKEAEALPLIDKVLAKDGKNARALLARGLALDGLTKYGEAVGDFTKAIELDGGKTPEAYDLRGAAYFKLGDMDKALADFDKFLQERPEAKPYHWKRGICCYYAKKYAEGNKQFEEHQTVNKNDVENAVWRYLCQARLIGPDKARARMLKIETEKDRRVPMAEVYDLFLGKAKPEDVLRAARAEAETPTRARWQMFYAHLYLGLYYESQGDAPKAREHIDLAAGKYGVREYMGDVARVHRDLLRKDEKAK
jgi:lipoprotein NlpI